MISMAKRAYRRGKKVEFDATVKVPKKTKIAFTTSTGERVAFTAIKNVLETKRVKFNTKRK